MTQHGQFGSHRQVKSSGTISSVRWENMTRERCENPEVFITFHIHIYHIDSYCYFVRVCPNFRIVIVGWTKMVSPQFFSAQGFNVPRLTHSPWMILLMRFLISNISSWFSSGQGIPCVWTCSALEFHGPSWSIMVPSAMRSGDTLAGFRPQRVPLMNLLVLKKTQDIPGSRKQQRKTCYNVSCGQNKVD